MKKDGHSKHPGKSASGQNANLNDDNLRMRANHEANPFKFINGSGVLLKEQVVGEDGQVYLSEEEAEESKIEHNRTEDFNKTWAYHVSDMISDSLEYGFGNDASDYEFIDNWNGGDYYSYDSFGFYLDDSYEMFDLGQVPVENLLHVDYEQAMQNVINNTGAFSPFLTSGGSPITSSVSPTASFNDVAGVPLTGGTAFGNNNTFGNNAFGAPAANDPSFNDLLKDDPFATPAATAPTATAPAVAPAPKVG